MIFGKSKRERELLEQIKLGYAVLNNPKVKFAWLPVKIKSINHSQDNGKFIWLEKYIYYPDDYPILYNYVDCGRHSIRKISKKNQFFEKRQPQIIKYDKDFETDNHKFIGTESTKKLVEDYIRKLEREFVESL